jgi:predicted carbohydrate-binding protein with CBM5 and CBM33 domain
MSRRMTFAGLGAAVLVLPVFVGDAAYAHGWVTGPASRQDNCAKGVVQDCGEIQWEPQSVEGPGGFPAEGPADGALCSGGNSRFSQLDDPRGGSWPTTSVTSGSQSFTWHNTAMHATEDWRYYITNQGYDPSQPLTRGALDLDPFLQVPGNNQQPPADVTHTGDLPDQSGHHVILAVWEIGDTPNAFYACIDVSFG